MPGNDVNISFNFTMDAEEAMELLTMIREKHHIHKNTKSTVTPKRQTRQDGERDPRFGRIPLTTIGSVVDKLLVEYENRVFSYNEAHALATKNNIARTTLGYALKYGVSQGRIKKLALGRYTFGPVTNYSVNPDSVIDLVSKDSSILIPVLKMMSEVSDIVNLYFSDQAVTARFRNHTNNAMLDIRIRQYAFDVMHVKGHVKVTLSCKQLVRVLSKRPGKRGAIHLQLLHAKILSIAQGFSATNIASM
jgi:hypothetical protein